MNKEEASYYPFITRKLHEVCGHRVRWVGKPCKTEKWALRKAKLAAKFYDHFVYLHTAGITYGVSSEPVDVDWNWRMG